MNKFTDKEKPNHALVVGLKLKGYINFQLIYDKTSFWCIESDNVELMNKTNGWLGFTIKSSLKAIEKL